MIHELETLTDLCKRLEHFETPEWAAKAILKKEILTDFVYDPCVGTGILADAAEREGYHVVASDIHDWGWRGFQDKTANRLDFLSPLGLGTFEWILDEQPFTIFMNPPFSKACEFVEKSFELGARKIVCFQRFAWWESQKRRAFWEKNPPSRVYICGDRAHCWRHDIPESQRTSSTPTAHAWFVWDRESPSGTLLSHIWRDDA